MQKHYNVNFQRSRQTDFVADQKKKEGKRKREFINTAQFFRHLLSILHMVMYVFPCCSLNSSHLLLPLLCPQVYSPSNAAHFNNQA